MFAKSGQMTKNVIEKGIKNVNFMHIQSVENAETGFLPFKEPRSFKFFLKNIGFCMRSNDGSNYIMSTPLFLTIHRNTYSNESKMFLNFEFIFPGDSGLNLKTLFLTKMLCCGIIVLSQCMVLQPRDVQNIIRRLGTPTTI